MELLEWMGELLLLDCLLKQEWVNIAPGGLILNEVIKSVCEKYSFIRSIDLSRGNEAYKYTYGGVEHYNYTYRFKIGEKHEDLAN